MTQRFKGLLKFSEEEQHADDLLAGLVYANRLAYHKEREDPLEGVALVQPGNLRSIMAPVDSDDPAFDLRPFIDGPLKFSSNLWIKFPYTVCGWSLLTISLRMVDLMCRMFASTRGARMVYLSLCGGVLASGEACSSR